MYQQNAASLNSVESWFAKSQEAQGELDKAIANEKQAAITYSYTHVMAPFDGMIGRHLISVGNLVGNGVATNLATIQQIDPLYVYFNLNEIDLIRLRDAAKAAGITREQLSQIPVDIALQTEEGFSHKAMLDFVNTGLNASTGTMELRAVLNNHDEFFVPGLFVQVRVAITPPTSFLTVPDAAVLYDQIGPYLLLVDKQNEVHLRRVVLGPKNEALRGIVKGIQKDDQVIINGIHNASPGRKVDPQTSAEALK
jgi:RND family efflux transporter MFP subunit